MTPGSLLRELDTLSHDQRMRRMAEVGKQAARDPKAAATLAALEQGDLYQRLLSLQACYGSRDGECVLRALAGKPQHGYAVARFIHDSSDGSFTEGRANRYAAHTRGDTRIRCDGRLRRRHRGLPGNHAEVPRRAAGDDVGVSRRSK